ncbi:FAD-binding oxidoreductase [Halobacillus locisalis]|uniref:FAD-binding oxidoreductase n=1 Tax=Halobacillus locisalis TaxID=220753 RepID=A0A838CPC9_9BACI|nr:FAD-dependent oxidoreductase [Halobacillus locisalis]MBA2173791.1 FAD-binding oxidoreductase [Halobacillus locisalis]
MKEAIIIGAGILGASTAYHLSKKGVKVKIVDRQDAGQATKAGAGIVCPWLTNRSNRSWYDLVLKGAKFYPELIRDLKEEGETETGYRQVGAINIFDTEEKLDKKMELARKRKEEAPEMGTLSKLSPKETKEQFPVLDETYRALYISGGARVNGEAINQALLRAAMRYGACFVKGEALAHTNEGRVVGVTIRGEIHYAEQIVVTNGAWSNELFKTLGLRSNVTFEKAQIVHLKLSDANTNDWPVLLPPFGHYQLGFPDGRVVIGATKEKGTEFDTRVTMSAVHELLEKALTVSPGLSRASYVGTRVGFRPFTKGSLPAIGQVPGHDNVWLANGLGASGLTSGPFVGAELAKAILKERTQIQLEKYSLDRVFH